MPNYIIERTIPGAGGLSPEELRAIAGTSCDVLSNLGGKIAWLHSYVVDNKFYCVYFAKNEELIREHARLGGFPIDSIQQIHARIDRATAEKQNANALVSHSQEEKH